MTTSSSNHGDALEQLIACIEGALSPRGYKVDIRKRVLNEEGTQIAEFDVLICGQLGSATVQYLIECRDRPGGGPAPASWIEQLIGRRARFRLDKVMAVSSTGFASGAVAAAKDAGVELRELQSLRYEDVAHWVPRLAPVVIRHADFSAVHADLYSPNHLMHRSGQFGTAEQLLTCLRTNEIVALKDIWQYMINCDAVWEGVVEDGPVVSKRLVAADYFVEPLGLNVDGAILPVNSIVFDATLKIYHPHMPFVEASDYVAPTGSTAGQPFAKIAQWKSEGESLISELTIVAFRPPIQGSLDTGAEADDQGPPGAS